MCFAVIPQEVRELGAAMMTPVHGGAGTRLDDVVVVKPKTSLLFSSTAECQFVLNYGSEERVSRKSNVREKLTIGESSHRQRNGY